MLVWGGNREAMLKLLVTANDAIAHCNWSLASQCLQELPASRREKGSIRLEAGDRQQAIDVAMQVLVAGDFQQRWEVAKVFPKLGLAAIAPLAELLADEDEQSELRWFAGRILGEFDCPTAIAALVELVRSTADSELAAAASESLANTGPAAIAALCELLSAESTRELAVRSLAYIRNRETIPPLLSVVNDPQPQVRAMAIEALGSFRDARIPPVLIAALRDLAAIVRVEAVSGLSAEIRRSQRWEWVKLLVPMLGDLDTRVCRETILALGRIGTTTATRALANFLASPTTPTELRVRAVSALGWIETREAIAVLAQELERAEEKVAREIIATLGRIEAPDLQREAVRVLVAFWNRSRSHLEEATLCQELAIAWGNLACFEGREPLLVLAASGDRSVELHAIAALRKLAPEPRISDHDCSG